MNMTFESDLNGVEVVLPMACKVGRKGQIRSAASTDQLLYLGN